MNTRAALKMAFTVLAVTVSLAGCATTISDPASLPDPPEHDLTWGIYLLDRATDEVELIHSSSNPLSRLDLRSDGQWLLFREDFGTDPFTDTEISMVGVDGAGYERLTDNDWLDACPCWAPDGESLVFLSWPDYPANSMDIYLMDSPLRGGGRPDTTLLYDSGFHDGDCDWQADRIVFTRESQIWIMDDDGENPTQLTDYELAGVQGNADLPFGDYDPRLRPDGGLVTFERMLDDHYPSGNYDFFTVTALGTAETQITFEGDSQFFAEWSNDGSELVYMLAGVDGQGVYDMYTMNPDGSDRENITPDHWPAEFLCVHPVFSVDDSQIYFIGQWYEP